MQRGIALLLLMPLAAACVKAPPREEPDIEVEPPEAWTAADTETTAPTDQWWSTFGDGRLDQLVPIALEQNRDLRAAVFRVEQAAAEARIAGADLKPSVGVGLDATRFKQNFPGIPIDPATASNLTLSVDVSWEVDLWGRLRAGARAALAELQATEADLRSAELSIAAQTARFWFAIAELTEQVKLAQESAESFAGLSEHIRSRYERGVRPALDLRLALSNQSAAEAVYQRRRAELDGAIRSLEVLLGEYPAASLLDSFPSSGLPEIPAPVPTGLPSELVARRPDLVAAERRLAAADQQYLVAKRSLYPRFTLTASGGTASAQLGDLIDGDFSVWSIFASLMQPVFQGGRLRAGVSRADAVADQALEFYAGSVLQAYSEVEVALAAEAYLAAEEFHLAEASRQLVAAERLAEDRYRLGVGGYLALLESQTRSFTAQSNLLTVRRIRLENRVNLHVALGGGFEVPAS